MSDDHPKKQRTLLIIGVAITLLLLGGLFFGVQENPFRKPFLTFTVRFDDVSGIHERSKVTFLGIPAGYVKQLDYEPGDRQTAIKVQVVINRKLYIPAAVRAYLEPTLLGDASIALRVPSDIAEDGTSARLADGAEIVGLRATKLEAVLPGFDETMAKVQTFGTSTGQHLTSIGEVIDRGVNGLNSVFLEKDATGQTKIDQLVTSLEGIINGPEGQKEQSIRGQLETIVGNLRASSESIRKLADVQGTEQGSLGEMLRVFEQTAKLLSADAETTQKLIAKMGRTSEAVTQASDQVKNLALVTTEAVQQFHSRPFHYLTTTRSAPAQGSRSPAASPRPQR
jgi:ABC-type transporter Mla subunit MlaD